MAKAIFARLDKSDLLRQEVLLNFRLHIIRCYIKLILSYRTEIWSLKVKFPNRIEAFHETWTLKRLPRLPWTRHMSIAPCQHIRHIVIECNHTIKNIILGLILRRLKYILLKTILIGKTEGKRGLNCRQYPSLQHQELVQHARCYHFIQICRRDIFIEYKYIKRYIRRDIFIDI